MQGIDFGFVVREFGLTALTEVSGFENIKIITANVNRPGIHLLGFFDSFDTKRIQIFGEGEMTFLSTLTDEKRKEILDKFFSYPIPCAIIARNIEPFKEMVEASVRNKVPLLRTSQDTSTFVSAIIRCLNYQLAPMTTFHGVHVDVYGEGILITGESGIGKSETALELIKRGHRFIADDVVHVKRVSYKSLIGEPPELIRHFIEIRGLGLIDVKQVFGVGAIKDSNKVNLVVRLESWDRQKNFDRLGINDQEIDILGIKVPCITVPVKPGRNLAVIIEAAAMNQREKCMGYNSAQVLDQRINEEIQKKKRS